jgi:hypothetical protein
MNILRIVKGLEPWKSKTEPFVAENLVHVSDEGYIDVLADEPSTTVSEFLCNKDNIRECLKAAANSGNLDRKVLSVLINQGTETLITNMVANSLKYEKAIIAIKKDDPNATILLDVEIVAGNHVVHLVFHLHGCCIGK